MKLLKVGDIAPNFEAKDEQGNTIKLSNYKGKKVILFFYPRANTPTCTVEACNLRDAYKLLSEEGYQIIGVSADSQKKQFNFKNKHKFPYPLIADEDKKVCIAYGVWGPKKFMGKSYQGIHRVTYVIDEQGTIIAVLDKVKAKDHANQILDAVS